MKISNWQATESTFTHSYQQQDLSLVWKQLHAADLETLPSGTLADAWLLFHNGHFEQAAQTALSIGPKASAVLLRSVVAYTDYICEDEDECVDLLKQAYKWADSIDSNEVNHLFTTALAMGRYSQSISITKALTKGLGGKIKNLLTAVLKAVPKHAEAHLAMAMYHAEIIDKVGSTLGGLTYGANNKTALRHIESALELAPNAINLIEAGNAVLLLKGDKAMDEATEFYQQAASVTPLDALQAMDVEFAQSQLED